MIQNYLGVFVGIGKFNGTCTITLKYRENPVVRPLRRVRLRSKIEIKSKDQESQSIIAKVDTRTS